MFSPDQNAEIFNILCQNNREKGRLGIILKSTKGDEIEYRAVVALIYNADACTSGNE